MKLVGIVGRAQHGKDTVGARLVDHWGYTRFAFADPLRSMALALDPWIPTDEMANMDAIRLSVLVEYAGWEEAKKEPEVRRFLQVLGTEGVRDHLGTESWVNATGKAIAEAGLPDTVITDCRFPNEAQFIRREGGILLRVIRPDFDNGLPAGHPSEEHVDLIKVDRTIVNEGTLRELVDQVDGLAADIAEGFVPGPLPTVMEQALGITPTPERGDWPDYIRGPR